MLRPASSKPVLLSQTPSHLDSVCIICYHIRAPAGNRRDYVLCVLSVPSLHLRLMCGAVCLLLSAAVRWIRRVLSLLQEHVVANLLPILLGPTLAGSHIVVLWAWTTAAVFSTVSSHSGYHLPLLSDPNRHDFHHSHNIGNYGPLGLLDWLHGTDKEYKDFVSKGGHRAKLQ